MNLAKLITFRRRVRAFLGRPILMQQQNIVTLETMTYCPNPVFVMGCHRSGTSLLRRMLNSHQNIACPPETNYLIHFINILQDKSSLAGLSGIMDQKDIKAEVARLAFRFHEAFRIANGKARWADKTPQYVSHFEALENLAPEQAQFVVIFRNPYDIAFSIYNRGWRLEELDDSLMINTCLYVQKTVKKLNEIAAKDTVHSLRYERMVAAPEQEARSLCAFLNEPWDEAMVRPWDFEHNFGTEDPIARAQKTFSLSTGNWKALAWKDQQVMHDYLGGLAQEMGYSGD